ncbi:hypothetical protein F4809DRAFT_657245 [Biscogniauxia mediterranea]|nr:hypothetical protein F4809DRAFT_657245 [Biscogniauxia mediterranea]
MDCSLQGLVELHKSQMDYALRSVIDAILNNSELELTLIRISNVTDEGREIQSSLTVSIEARVTNTGPARATLSPMTVSLCGPGGACFGQVALPGIKTSPAGAALAVGGQHVRIASVPALLAFVRPVVRDAAAVLALRGGRATVRALGAGPRDICYEKDVPLPGMRGPDVRVRSFAFALAASSSSSSAGGGSTSNNNNNSNSNSVVLVLHVSNPSPMEISFGTCGFEIVDGSGGGGGDEEEVVFAELKGRLDMRRGGFEATVQGTLVDRRALVAAGEACRDGRRREAEAARLVGKRCAGAAWCDEAVKGIDVPLRDMWRVFGALGIECGGPEKPPASHPEEKGREWEIEEMTSSGGDGSGGGGGWKKKLWKW